MNRIPFKISTIKDHKGKHPYIALLCPDVTVEEVHNDRDNILVLQDIEDDTNYGAVVMGHRDVSSYTDSNGKEVKVAYFLITHIGISLIAVPSFSYLFFLLKEFVADKNDTRIEYHLTGQENENVLIAMKMVGFYKGENDTLVRLPMYPINRYRFMS